MQTTFDSRAPGAFFLLPLLFTDGEAVKNLYLFTFFYLGRFLRKLADDQYSIITKESIYHIKHMYIQPFTTEMGSLMEVSTMFYMQILRFYLVRQTCAQYQQS